MLNVIEEGVIKRSVDGVGIFCENNTNTGVGERKKFQLFMTHVTLEFTYR